MKQGREQSWKEKCTSDLSSVRTRDKNKANVSVPLGLQCLHLENDVGKSSHHGFGGRTQINWLQAEDLRFQQKQKCVVCVGGWGYKEF